MTEILDKFKKLCCDYGHKSPSVFAIEFKRIRELEEEIESSLKLQELAKEQLPLLIKSMNEFKQTDRVEYNFQRAKVEILQSLIEESQK